VYEDNEKASSDYRKIYNNIEFYKEVFGMLYSKNDTITQDISDEKKIFREYHYDIRNTLTEILLNMETSDEHKATPTFKDLLAIHSSYNQKYKELGEQKVTLQFFVDEFLDPLNNTLPKYIKNKEALRLLILVSKTLHQRDYIVQDTIALGNLILKNLGSLPACITELKLLSSTLDNKLIDLRIRKKSVKNWFKNKLDI
jgi:hypothetical protein